MSQQKLQQTPSQTVGPYFAYGLTPEQYLYDFPSVAAGQLVMDTSVEGERIAVFGRVYDGVGQPIPDAMIELWQADAAGRYGADRSSFHGFGRAGTGTTKDFRFEFTTIKPGRVNQQAPHLNLIVFMRGLLVHAYTRLYFSDEEAANATDQVLQSVESGRRHTLLAHKMRREDGTVAYQFDIFMQGENETVFFDV